MSNGENIRELQQLEVEIKLVEQGVSPDQIAEYRAEVDDQVQRTLESVKRVLREYPENE